MIGGLLAPWEGLDVYTYVGLKQAKANFFTSGTTLFGYKIRGIGGQMIDPNARESNTKMLAGWQVGNTFFRMS
jgi:hypothetical protein